MKLEVFKKLLEERGVRAFALEGDCGGCEAVNRYIHGGEGTAQEAAAAIGFAIYRTEEMAELVSYLREYNENASAGEDVRFYGFDMQRISRTFQFLMEGCAESNIDTTELEKLTEGENLNPAYDLSAQAGILSRVKNELESSGASDKTLHYADMLLQYCELQSVPTADGGALRDGFMAENVKWIFQQEQQRGHERIFVTGHNSHVAKWGSYDSMGKNCPRTQRMVTMRSVRIFIERAAICRRGHPANAPSRCFIPMTPWLRRQNSPDMIAAGLILQKSRNTRNLAARLLNTPLSGIWEKAIRS